MSKPHITRTLAPIHFEDLEPHRFEDLVRQLAYDFRQWKSIESTGRGGADDGFDIRAYESVEMATSDPEEDESEAAGDPPHPMEGNLWMIQCKREREVGPRKVAKIISDGVHSDSPPYGYILAAPVHFSKAAHDKFREELRGRGVMEFFLWGAGELEDMLFQPKNDRLLFAFFGISLTTRRRSRTTEIRASIGVKNKLLRALGEEPRHQTVLLRDLADLEYPFEDRYSDFETRPRWQEHIAVRFHPLGLVVSMRKEFAYYDRLQRTWDFTKAVNVARHATARPRREDIEEAARLAVKGFWELLPKRNRAMFVTDALVKFDSIALVDDKGDSAYKCPHVFVEFHPERGAFAGVFKHLELNEHHHEYVDDLSRISVFPDEFSAQAFGKVYDDRTLAVDEHARATLRINSGDITVYDLRQQYTYLKPTDVIPLEGAKDHEGQPVLVKITNARMLRGSELFTLFEDNPPLRYTVEQQIGQELKAKDKVHVIEAMAIYRWQLEQNRPVL
jgi:hypothetical protein